jgi:hypothetical protein
VRGITTHFMDEGVITFTMPPGSTAESLPSLPVQPTLQHNGRAEIIAPEPMPVLFALSSWAVERGLPIPGIAVQRPSMTAAIDPATNGGHTFARGDLGIVVLWGIFAGAVAIRRFTWSPSQQ